MTGSPSPLRVKYARRSGGANSSNSSIVRNATTRTRVESSGRSSGKIAARTHARADSSSRASRSASIRRMSDATRKCSVVSSTQPGPPEEGQTKRGSTRRPWAHAARSAAHATGSARAIAGWIREALSRRRAARSRGERFAGVSEGIGGAGRAVGQHTQVGALSFVAMDRSSEASRAGRLPRGAWRAARAGSLPALLGAWLVAKQLLGAPPVQGAPVRAAALASSAAVALLVVALALRFHRRAQLLVLLALDVALTAVYQVQLFHHRQFSELASVAALGLAGQAAHVADAIVALHRPSDALLWADVAALAVLVAFAPGRAAPALPPRRANALALAGLLLFTAAALPLAYRPLTGPRRLAVTRAEVAATLNLVGYQLFDAATYLRRRLDPSGRVSLAEALAYHRGRPFVAGPLSGTERGRNVVVVQLESVQAFAAGRRVEGGPVTPSLDRLARESLSFTRAFAQVGQGVTSDAELLAGCSVYPLDGGAVFTERHDVDLRCLPEVLREAGYHTVAMHANWPNFWNRDRMYPAMGYAEMLSIRDFDRTPVVGMGLSDVRFLEQAADRLAALPEPFYAVLVTLSNHAPFVDSNLPDALATGALEGTTVGDYLNSVRFTDEALGRFVERLRANGVLDRSVLVVYGDHHGVSRNASGTALLDLPRTRGDVWLQHEARVPMLVRLPGARHAGPRDEPAGEVDLAPTIADLLAIDREETFFHGRSLVSGPARPVVFPDGSAVTGELVLVSGEGRWGAPGCLASDTGSPVAPERCDALAEHAARELSVSRAEVNHDLFRAMLAARPARPPRPRRAAPPYKYGENSRATPSRSLTGVDRPSTSASVTSRARTIRSSTSASSRAARSPS